MKCNKNTNTKYKRITIRNLFNSLEEVMARNSEITLDSEVIISDLNMGVFKSELRVYPTFDYKDRKTKIGIYLNPYEKDELVEEISEKIKTTQESLVTEDHEVKVEYIKTEEPVKELAWLKKYAR